MRGVVTASVPRSMPTLMPAKYQAKLRYSTTFTLTPSAANIVSQRVFSANGMYDPDVTGVGHQPRGFDQIMSLYSHYTVTKCEMRCMFDASQPHDGAYIIGIYEDQLQASNTDPEDIMEKSKMVSYMNSTALGRNTVKFTSYPNRRLGYNNPGNLQGPYKGSSSTNPSDQIFLKPFTFWPSNQHTIQDVTVVAVIDYTAVFSELIQPTKS